MVVQQVDIVLSRLKYLLYENLAISRPKSLTKITSAVAPICFNYYLPVVLFVKQRAQ